jgi:hypothetical protein
MAHPGESEKYLRLKQRFEKLRQDSQFQMWRDVVKLRKQFLEETGLSCLECGCLLNPESINWPICDCGSKSARNGIGIES